MSFLAAIGSIAGGFFSSRAANKATQAQTEAANRQIDVWEEQTERTRQDLSPWRVGGENALAAYMHNLGMGPAPTIGGTAPEITTIPGAGSSTPLPEFNAWRHQRGLEGDEARIAYQRAQANQTVGADRYSVNGNLFDTMEEAQAYADANPAGGSTYGGYTASPGYQWQLEQGQDSINALAGASGGLHSGATLQALSDYNQGLASQDFYNHQNSLLGLAGMGQSSAAMTATAGQNAATGISNALGNIGNAQAAGATAQGNILNRTFSDLGGIWQYQKNQPGGWGANAPAWL